ncbi:DNA-processing protein DprA [uncultured Campylobacter sp.]|uniref:DNA-processing protein DprA n=1 Tax=uncultured Campylobacter sp. TaxID=218934 RepID=UPI00261B1C5F|nr:DNA-processing protein DprA [uncultured Campylobacter sp.]
MSVLTELPRGLLRLKKLPAKLYSEGNLALLERPMVSIVGSRKASAYTRQCVEALARTLASSGVCVVSGAAIGVDIAAHRGAYPYTVAVFGNGLNKIYPPSNAKIIKEIYQNALALSEYAPDEPPLAYRFLERNRIVVALSQALVVAQADAKSGSMQSARMAKELGVPIFTLPQRLGESDGTNELVASGAANLINDFDAFALRFGGNPAPVQEDEVIKFCKNGASLDVALLKFGDKIYEYELEGKLRISGLTVFAG